MQKKPNAIHRIAWAVNPFDEDKSIFSRSAEALRAYCQTLPEAEIHPIHILSPDHVDSQLDGNLFWVQNDRPAAERALRYQLGQLDLPGLRPPKVIVESENSTLQSVRTLLAYVHCARMDAVAVGTHGRSGLIRLLSGSFTEVLLAQSDLPILTVGPSSRVFQTMRNLLFPVGAEESEAALAEIAKLAKDQGSRLLLLCDHQVASERRLAQWVDRAIRGGTQVEILIRPGEGMTALQRILSAAEQLPVQLIALAKQGTLISLVRQLMKHAPCPLWVSKAQGELVSLKPDVGNVVLQSSVASLRQFAY